MKRYLALILVVLAMLSLSAVVSAENEDARASDYFSTYGISLSNVGGGRISITFSCNAVGTASQIGVSNYNVQRYNEEDGYWVQVTGTLSGSYSYNSSNHSFAKVFQGVSGEKYRVKCTFLCVKDGTAESKNYTSRTIQAQ